jgi:hypothetical protein
MKLYHIFYCYTEILWVPFISAYKLDMVHSKVSFGQGYLSEVWF